MEFATRSDIGRVRERNEDALEIRPGRGWAVLADGMGGHRGGDVAAQAAVAAALRRLDAAWSGASDIESIARSTALAVEEANTEVLRIGSERLDLAGLGATLVVAVFLANQVVCAHVGDSRLYRMSRGRLERMTRDHTVLQEQIDSGMMSAEEARHSCWRGVLTRGVGVCALVEPDVAIHAARPGDVFLLCTDGLTDMVSDAEIAGVLSEGGAADSSAQRLIELANQRGGRDNVSVIVVRIDA